MGDEKTDGRSWFTPTDLNIKINETTYLSMDLSVSALKGKRSRVSTLGQHARDQNLLANCQKALEASRSAGVYVVHVRVALRPGYPEYGEECAPLWKRVRETEAYIEGTTDTQICEEVAPKENEPIITPDVTRGVAKRLGEAGWVVTRQSYDMAHSQRIEMMIDARDWLSELS